MNIGKTMSYSTTTSKKNSAKSSIENPSSVKFDIKAFTSTKEQKVTENRTNVAENSSLINGMSSEVKEAWDKAAKETGFNPLTNSEGKIVGSALLAKSIEMEYRLASQYGLAEARAYMNNIFSDKDSATSLVSAALERAKNPLSGDKDHTQLELEKQFYEFFLSHIV